MARQRQVLAQPTVSRVAGALAKSPLANDEELKYGVFNGRQMTADHPPSHAWLNPVLAEDKNDIDRAVFQGAAPANELQAYVSMEQGAWMPEYQAAGVTAGMVGLPAIQAVDLKILLQEIFGLMRPNYNLRQVCRVVNMAQLKASLPVFTKMTAQQKVPEFGEAEVGAGAWQTVDFLLWKNVMHIAMSDESQARALVDVWGSMVRDSAGALAAAENSQIATALASTTNTVATSASGGSGGVWTDAGNFSASAPPYNPFIDINLAINTQWKAGFRTTHLVAHPSLWSIYFSNRFVKGLLNGVVLPTELTTGTGTFPVPGFPGITGVSDLFVVSATGSGPGTGTNTMYALAADSAIALGVGPTEAAQYRNEAQAYTAYIIRQYLEPQIVVKQAVYGITGCA
jgi:hypothetical protein